MIAGINAAMEIKGQEQLVLVLHGLETDEREIDGEYLIPLGEYMCFRQTKSESSIVLMYSEEQGRLYVFETVI